MCDRMANVCIVDTGQAHLRDPRSNRCTMSAAEPVRHFRDGSSAPITRLPADIPGGGDYTDVHDNAVQFELGMPTFLQTTTTYGVTCCCEPFMSCT